MKKEKSEIHPGKKRIEAATKELKKINKEMRIFLNKLPLTNYRDILRLSRVAHRQEELIRFSPGPAPPALTVFLENAKYTALHLSKKYWGAMNDGLIRKKIEEPPKPSRFDDI